MKFDIKKIFDQTQKQSALVSIARLSSVSTVLLTCVVAFNTVTIQSIDQSRITVIQPMGLDLTYEIGNNSANDAYIRRMGTWLTAAYLNINALNVERSFGEILELAHPANRTAIQKYLKERQNIIEKYPSVNFTGRVNGRKVMKVAGSTMLIPVVREKDMINLDRKIDYLGLQVGFVISKSRFYLTSIKEVVL